MLVAGGNRTNQAAWPLGWVMVTPGLESSPGNVANRQHPWLLLHRCHLLHRSARLVLRTIAHPIVLAPLWDYGDNAVATIRDLPVPGQAVLIWSQAWSVMHHACLAG